MQKNQGFRQQKKEEEKKGNRKGHERARALTGVMVQTMAVRELPPSAGWPPHSAQRVSARGSHGTLEQ
eukprot:2468343-Rhodomonas_salina.1